MEQIFLKLLNLSISAAWLVLGVVILRLVLKKAPKWVRGVLWSLVGLRLLFPFSLESVFSLIPSAETVPPEILTEPVPQIHSGVAVFNSAVNPVLEQNFAPQAGDSANPMQVVVFLCSVVWLVGLCAMLCYSLLSYLRIRLRVQESVKEGAVYLCDNIASPFILGLFRPRIYVPGSLSQEDLPYVLAHEQAHLRRRDHLWKPLAFLLLSIYWFQPVLWLAYVLLCRDIELACDEKVLKKLGPEGKKPYSSALLNCAVSRKLLSACPLAFGELSVKTRIKSILDYKKPAFWLTILALIACTVAAVCLLTSPPKEEMEDNVQIGTTPEGFAASCEIKEATQPSAYTGPVFFDIDSDGEKETIRLFGPTNPGEACSDYYFTAENNNGEEESYVGSLSTCAELSFFWDGDLLKLKAQPEQGQAVYYRLQGLDGRLFFLVQEEETGALIHAGKGLDRFAGWDECFTSARLLSEMEYDLDKDGKEELCSLYFGRYSGLFDVYLCITEDGRREYVSRYVISCNDPRFVMDDGTLKLCGDAFGGGTVIMELVLEKDTLLLQGEGVDAVELHSKTSLSPGSAGGFTLEDFAGIQMQSSTLEDVLKIDPEATVYYFSGGAVSQHKTPYEQYIRILYLTDQYRVDSLEISDEPWIK